MKFAVTPNLHGKGPFNNYVDKMFSSAYIGEYPYKDGKI